MPAKGKDTERSKRIKPRIDLKKWGTELKRNMPVLEPYFVEEGKRHAKLLAKEHDTIGRLLKCHLIIEHYLNEYLEKELGLKNLDKVRLRFAQKAHLLPNEQLPLALVKPGILKLNKIRNDFAHDIQAKIKSADLKPMREALVHFRPGRKTEDVIDEIEVFTELASGCLRVKPPEIKKVLDKVNLASLKIFS